MQCAVCMMSGPLFFHIQVDRCTQLLQISSRQRFGGWVVGLRRGARRAFKVSHLGPFAVLFQDSQKGPVLHCEAGFFF